MLLVHGLHAGPPHMQGESIWLFFSAAVQSPRNLAESGINSRRNMATLALSSDIQLRMPSIPRKKVIKEKSGRSPG